MLRINNDACIGCGLCEANCPFGAIAVIDGCARVNESCVLCGTCVDVCEAGALSIDREERAGAAALSSWAGVMVFAECRGREIAPVAFELLGVGRGLADQRGVKLSAVLLGKDVSDLAVNLIGHGADIVYLVDDPGLADFTDDACGNALCDIIRAARPETVLAGATAIGRSVIPRVATMLATGLTADCTGLAIDPASGNLLQTRPAFGGNIMATIVCPNSRPQMATVRPNVMKPLPFDPARAGQIAPVTISPDRLKSRVRVLASDRQAAGSGVRLDEADFIVAGGRGLGNADGFALLRELASLYGGEVAASRPAVDSGWIQHAHQVGQTGKTVSPRVYLGCGISGAIQHVIGMQGADTVIAINCDENAPIFDVATCGVVGDLYEILPRLVARIKKERAS